MRVMTKDTWLPLVLLLATASWQSRMDRRRIGFILVCILLGVMTLLLFANLHIVHNCYQSSNHLFPLLAIVGSGALHSRATAAAGPDSSYGGHYLAFQRNLWR